MPVPITPKKSPPSANTEEMVDLNKALVGDVPLECFTDPIVAAGYQECLRETLRFLIQEENLSVEHPVVAGLAMHLTCDNAQQELVKVSEEFAQALNEHLKQPTTEMKECPLVETKSSSEDSGMDSSFSDDEVDSFVKAYQITLEEEYDSEVEDEDELEMDIESDEEELLVTGKDILSNPNLRKELIRLVFQGCDLVASPISQLSSSVVKT